MSTLRLVLSEIRFRLLNFLLCLLVVVLAAAFFVVTPTLISGYAKDARLQLEKLQQEADRMKAQTQQMKTEMERELADLDRQTRRIMRDLGVNLRIVHKDTNMASLYTDFVAVDFPQDYVYRLAQARGIETIVHVVATLQDRIKWHGRTVLLVGTLPVMTQSQKNAEKPHMVKPVEKGTVLVGHELGAGLKQGDTIEIEGRKLKVAKIMPEYGGLQDVQLVCHLEDAQAILGKAGRINQIVALSCKCRGNRLSAVRAELETILPDTKVTEFRTQATAREKQRDLVEAVRKRELARAEANLRRVIENRDRQRASRLRQQRTLARLLGIMTPLVVFASALFVALMMWLNARERRVEIGVLRALGKDATAIAALFLGKAALLGVAGGVIGCLAGYFLAPVIGSRALDTAASLFATDRILLAATVAGTPVVTVMASYLPTLSAIAQDPAIVLMDT